MAKEKFRVELEIEVEYDVPEGVATYPYTHIKAWLDRHNIVNLETDAGKIVDVTPTKLVNISDSEVEE